VKHLCIAVHATDNHGRIKGEHVDDEHLFPGEGIIPWSQVLTKMRKLGFDGPVTIECPIKPELMQQFADLVYVNGNKKWV
jgi:sugar phosphate isomerase/epimerase